MDLADQLTCTQKTLELKGYQLAHELRITPEWLSKIKSRRVPASEGIELRLAELIRRRGFEPTSFFELDTSMDMEESTVRFRRPRKPLIISPSDNASPLAAPDRAAIEALFTKYLDVAEQVPGGLGHAWVQVKLHLKIDDLEKLIED